MKSKLDLEHVTLTPVWAHLQREHRGLLVALIVLHRTRLTWQLAAKWWPGAESAMAPGWAAPPGRGPWQRRTALLSWWQSFILMDASLPSVNPLYATAGAMTSPLALCKDSKRYKTVRKHQRYYLVTRRIGSKCVATTLLLSYKRIVTQLHMLAVCRVSVWTQRCYFATGQRSKWAQTQRNVRTSTHSDAGAKSGARLRARGTDVVAHSRVLAAGRVQVSHRPWTVSAGETAGPRRVGSCIQTHSRGQSGSETPSSDKREPSGK